MLANSTHPTAEAIAAAAETLRALAPVAALEGGGRRALLEAAAVLEGELELALVREAAARRGEGA